MPIELPDPNYGRVRQRIIEWAERQQVSLLDIDGIGHATRRALRKAGFEVASQLMNADAQDVVNALEPYHIPPCSDRDKAVAIVRGWQEEMRRRWSERERELKRLSEQSTDR